MADSKISALTSGAPAQAGDEYIVARSGANYKLTGTNLLALVTGTANTFTAAQTFGTANATTVDATNVEVTNIKAKDGTAAVSIADSTGVVSVSTKVEFADGSASAPAVTNTGDTNTGVYFPAADEIAVTTGGSERMRIDASGNVGIGGTATATDKVTVTGTLPTSSNTSIGFMNRGTVPSGTTSTALSYGSVLNTEAASFTLSQLDHFRAGQGTFGAGSTVTTQYGFHARSTLTGATNNYGFYGDIASGSNRWNFYAAGTAQNYFAGVTTIGTTSTNLCAGNVAGIGFGTTADGTAATGGAQFSIAGNPGVNVNRKTDDGALVGFYQDGTLEGTISVAGNTISYNAFAGSHWSQLQDGSKPDILRGTVMESINELCAWPGEQNERLPKSKISDTAGSKKVYGVFMAWDNDWTATNDMLITSVGAFICRVNSAVTVQEGDLLESNGDGTARVQADDIIRSSTIGKVTSTVKTHQYNDGSYCVPTVLYCG